MEYGISALFDKYEIKNKEARKEISQTLLIYLGEGLLAGAILGFIVGIAI